MVALNKKPDSMDWQRWSDVVMEALIICELELYNEKQRSRILAEKNLALEHDNTALRETVHILSEELTGGA